MKVEIDLPEDATSVSLTMTRGWFPYEMSVLCFDPRTVRTITALVVGEQGHERTQYAQVERKYEE